MSYLAVILYMATSWFKLLISKEILEISENCFFPPDMINFYIPLITHLFTFESL